MFLLLACTAPSSDSSVATPSDSFTDSPTESPVDSDPCEPLELFEDGDGDGYGGEAVTECERDGLVAQGGDCDDQDPAAYPGAVEVCDRVDNDCDGAVDFDRWVPDDVPTVNEAIALGGHTCLDEGTHITGDVVSSLAFTLEGQGSDRTVLDADGRHFARASQDVTLIGLHLTNVWTNDRASPGLYMTGGDAVLRDVHYSDVTLEYHNGHEGLLVRCGADCSVELDDVHVYDVTGVHTHFDDHTYPMFGSVVMGGGGDLVVRDSSIHDLVVGGHSGDALLVWDGATSVVEDTSFHDNHSSVLMPYYSGDLWGPMRLENTGETRVERVVSRDNTHVADVSYARLAQPFFGQIVSDEGATVRNIEVRGNRVEGAGAYESWALVVSDFRNSTSVENALVVDNAAEVITDSRGLFFGVGRIANCDLVGNDLGASETWHGLVVNEHGSTDVINTNLVDNAVVAETSLGSLATGTVTASYNNLWGNSLPEGDLGMAAPELEVDPLYADDYSLQDGSPVIDAGHPDVLDADGSPSDLGSFGGPYG